ncbi:MAG TPA: hypothetical protein VFE63_11255 [Roseiarcus sp.]|nr:hypothetical protein [Roseiarcus sp.]
MEFVIGLMADGWREVEILENYPGRDARRHSRLSRMRATRWARRGFFPSAA